MAKNNYPENNLAKTTIKEWAEEDKPREKLLQKGVKALTDAELIAILIRSGNRKHTALDLAKNLMLQHDNNVQNLSRANAMMVHKKGVGVVAAITIVAAIELGLRSKAATNATSDRSLNSSVALADYIKVALSNLPHEEFWILLLNNRMQPIGKKKIASGGITSAAVDIRIVLREALLNDAINIVLVHNHPSGALLPSSQDIELTKKIKIAAHQMDICVCDHIIIGKEGYYSFYDDNKL